MGQAELANLGEQRRRSTRLEHTLPVIVRGIDLLGQPFEERTATQAVSFHGCKYSSKHHLPKNTWVTIEVPEGAGQKERTRVRARVAWIQRPRTLRELFHVGVEMETGGNIWGIDDPPQDWQEGTPAARGNVRMAAPEGLTDDQSRAAANSRAESSLETYLERFVSEAAAGPTDAESGFNSGTALEDNPLLRELQNQLDSRTHKVLAEARAHAEQVVRERANEMHSELHKELEQEQRASAEDFYKRWREEFDREQAGAKQKIAAELTQQINFQLAQAQQEVEASLTSQWESGLAEARAALLESRMNSERLSEEARSTSEEIAARAMEGLETKLDEQIGDLRRQLEALGADAFSIPSPQEEGDSALKGMRERLDSKLAETKAQWNELLESSLDNAAQRLIARLTENSQRILQTLEQKLAARVAQLEHDSGRSVEEARGALEEVRTGLAGEVAGAKTSLAEMEQAAGRFSEHSRQLEAASDNSLNELQKRLDASVASQMEEMERRASELMQQVFQRAEPQLEQLKSQTVTRAIAEVEAGIAPGLERTAEAARQLSAREEQAEEILRIHRERLRQVAEQMRKEAASQSSEALSSLRNEFEGAREDGIAKWSAELAAGGARVTEECTSSLATASEWQVQEAGARLKLQIQEALQRAQGRMEESMAGFAARFPEELRKVEAAEFDAARAALDQATAERLQTIRAELALAGESEGTKFRETADAAAQTALKNLTTESDTVAESGRCRMMASAEQVIQGIEEHAQKSVEQFQEELAAKLSGQLAEAQSKLDEQLTATLEEFSTRGDTELQTWSSKLEALSSRASERHEELLRSASNSTISSALQQMETVGHERMETVIGASEEAIRKTCVAVFDGLARAIKQEMLGEVPLRRESSPPKTEGSEFERRASA